MSNKKVSANVWVALGIGAVAIAGYGLWLGAHPAVEPFYGMVQARTVDVAAKVTGRVQTLSVREGDSVKEGQTLLSIDIPELEAKWREVQAMQTAAGAKESLVNEGARPQEIRAAKAQKDQAQAGFELARKTYNRIHALYKDGLISKQKYDEALAQYRSALNYSQENLDSARTALSRLYTALKNVKVAAPQGGEEYVERFKAAMDDDFNTPAALAVLFDLAKAINTAKDEVEASGLAGRLVELGGILGILYQDPVKFLQSGAAASGADDEVAKIEALIEQRKQARANKDYAAADAARNELTAMGIVLEDGPNGTTWRRA